MLDIATGQLTLVHGHAVGNERWRLLPFRQIADLPLNADGRSDVYLVDIATLRAEKLPLKAGLNTLAATQGSYAPNGDRLLLSHESSGEPVDFWVHDTVSGRDMQLTHTAIASLGSAVMPEAQIVHYQSFDGLIISALLWMPFNLARDGSHPALVLPHGGPTWQMRTTGARTSRRWCPAATSASRPTCAGRPATARRSSAPTTRIWAAAICRTRSTPRTT